MPLPGLMWPLSGQFGTPFARMHLANGRNDGFGPPEALVTVPLEAPVAPQPAIAAQPSTAVAIHSDLTQDLRSVPMVPRCTPANVTGA